MKPEDLTGEVLIGYFGKYCECRPVDVERRSHSHDCNDDPCENVRVALGGRPDGCGYRGTVEAIIHTQAAKQRICEDINKQGLDTTALAAAGADLRDQAARVTDALNTPQGRAVNAPPSSIGQRCDPYCATP